MNTHLPFLYGPVGSPASHRPAAAQQPLRTMFGRPPQRPLLLLFLLHLAYRPATHYGPSWVCTLTLTCTPHTRTLTHCGSVSLTNADGSRETRTSLFDDARRLRSKNPERNEVFGVCGSSRAMYDMASSFLRWTAPRNLENVKSGREISVISFRVNRLVG